MMCAKHALTCFLIALLALVVLVIGWTMPNISGPDGLSGLESALTYPMASRDAG